MKKYLPMFSLLTITILFPFASHSQDDAKTEEKTAEASAIPTVDSVKKANDAYMALVKGAKDKYVKALQALADAEQKKGNLDGIEELKPEIDKMNDSATTASKAEFKNPLAKKAQDAFSKEMVGLNAKYVADLQKAQADEVKAGKLDNAKLIKSYIATLGQPIPESGKEESDKTAPGDIGNGKSSAIDLLKEYDNGKWKDLVKRGKWKKGDEAYELIGESGGGSDIGWSYPLNGMDTFTISMTFRMANAGAIQVVFTEKPQIIQGYGVALSYAWNKGFSVGNLDSRGKDMKTVELPRINKGWHELEIKVTPSSISAKLDNGGKVSWKGAFSPTCVLLSGDEHGDWYIKKLILNPNKLKSPENKDNTGIEPKPPMPKKDADEAKDSKK